MTAKEPLEHVTKGPNQCGISCKVQGLKPRLQLTPRGVDKLDASAIALIMRFLPYIANYRIVARLPAANNCGPG
jgi:hypothetical protein